MASNFNQGHFNIYSLMRQAVREEIENIFMSDAPKNTSVNLSAPANKRDGGTPKRRRKTRKPSQAKNTENTKGRVTRPDDKRLKANREV